MSRPRPRPRTVSVARVSAARGAKLFRLPSKGRPRKSRGDLDELAALFDLGPFDRNQVNRDQIDQLRQWIDEAGLPTVCKELEVSPIVILRVCAGFGHRMTSKTASKIRKYFGINS
jgi:hypothetical protein